MAAPAHTPPAPHAPHTPRTPPDCAVIESLDQEGRGVAHVDGKVYLHRRRVAGRSRYF